MDHLDGEDRQNEERQEEGEALNAMRISLEEATKVRKKSPSDSLS